jgi:hypothetical protein
MLNQSIERRMDAFGARSKNGRTRRHPSPMTVGVMLSRGFHVIEEENANPD